MVSFQKRVQNIQLFFRLHYHVILHELSWGLVNCVNIFLFIFCRSNFIMFDSVQKNTFGLFHTFLRQFVDLIVKSGREEKCLASWDTLQNRVESVSESHFKHDIGLVDHQHLQVVSLEPVSFLQMLKQSSRSAYQHIHNADLLLFVLDGFSTDDKADTDFHMMSK
jgi:hypothetical protein